MSSTLRTEVVEDCRQWVVYLLLIDPEGITRRRLSAHRTEREALLTASLVQRAAHRRGRPPPDGDLHPG
ncbi:MAG: hypothetical protein Q8O56_12995 [Solirubrobacteraceae bacterium]|nr:hypothetical protein [Solirubrobacteraceae bacterium]